MTAGTCAQQTCRGPGDLARASQWALENSKAGERDAALDKALALQTSDVVRDGFEPSTGGGRRIHNWQENRVNSTPGCRGACRAISLRRTLDGSCLPCTAFPALYCMHMATHPTCLSSTDWHCSMAASLPLCSLLTPEHRHGMPGCCPMRAFSPLHCLPWHHCATCLFHCHLTCACASCVLLCCFSPMHTLPSGETSISALSSRQLRGGRRAPAWDGRTLARKNRATGLMKETCLSTSDTIKTSGKNQRRQRLRRTLVRL